MKKSIRIQKKVKRKREKKKKKFTKYGLSPCEWTLKFQALKGVYAVNIPSPNYSCQKLSFFLPFTFRGQLPQES